MRVSDPFNVAAEPEMPSLALALDPDEAQREFANRRLVRLAGEFGHIHLQAIRVVRYKPGRRCVIEYDVRVERPCTAPEEVTLIGKVRSKRFGKSGYQLLSAIWDTGFAADSEDGISVPEPLGTISKFRMWLQRKVPGRIATDLLAEPGGARLGKRIAEAAHKLHQTAIPTERSHTMADELRILRDCLSRVARVEPAFATRIARVLDKCELAGAATPNTAHCGIHRDFYGDQIIVAGSRLYLIDFDLYCAGDPALDAGNFLGHITEQSLRSTGDPNALANVAEELEERFVELAGGKTRTAVQTYTKLTLVRHIYLSSIFPERRPYTKDLLELCEDRLDISSPSARKVTSTMSSQGSKPSRVAPM